MPEYHRNASFTNLDHSARAAVGVEPLEDNGVIDQVVQDRNDKMWDLMGTYMGTDQRTIQRSIVNHIEYTLARTRFNFTNETCYQATAHSVRDRLVEAFNDTNVHFEETDPKRVYYLSLEFLIGRLLQNHLVNLDLDSQYKNALMDMGIKMEDLVQAEKDPALGNGGLGRLAACFMDSMATLNYPAWGYGIRYTYGMFQQHFSEDGDQLEAPDYWLANGNPWEIERLDVQFTVRFYGEVHRSSDTGQVDWSGGELVNAIAYDTPISGYDTYNTINLRLWRAAPSSEFDLSKFNQGDYLSAVAARQRAETISSVLYPNDSTSEGRELRLKQQYFFCCATLQDILVSFKAQRRKFSGDDNPDYQLTMEDWALLPQKVAIQLNDTHPTISVVEMLRVLIDEEQMTYDEAFALVHATFAYTNHTILPEALEKWPMDLFKHVLPRHLQIIFEINARFLQKVEETWPGDVEKTRKLSIIEESFPKQVRMANLAIVCTHATNGVAALHSDLLKSDVFPEFFELYPHKFQNKTNGVTPRRWIKGANPGLSDLITTWLGTDGWLKDLDQLKGLTKFAEDPDMHEEWSEVKLHCKKRLATYIKDTLGVEVVPHALFDVHVKRIHEYKRQLMNILYCIHRWSLIKEMDEEERKEVVPRVVIFGGKAAPGYDMAKKVIKLIHSVGSVVNNDPAVSPYLKIVYLPNYNVSSAEVIIPASDISQHISTAGMEASGTSNMKFCMNGGIILGTMDGANVEIAEEVGEENMFIFGVLTPEVEKIRHELRFRPPVPVGAALANVLDLLQGGVFGDYDSILPILNKLEQRNDYYLVTRDFRSYVKAQEKVDATFKNKAKWTQMSILNTAGSGKFSTDRTMKQYAADIWGVDSNPRPDPRQAPEGMVRNRSFPNMV